MTDIWSGIRPLLDVLQVQPWMYPVLMGFGITHQFACAYFSWWTRWMSFASALLFASVFGGLSCGAHGLASLDCGIRVVTLLSGALIAEGVVSKIPGVPKYNEKVTPKEAP